MPTSHNFEGCITRVAPVGACTAGSVYVDSTDKVVFLAMTTATSGSDVIAKVIGRVNGARKTSGTAWTAGQRLSNDGTAFSHVLTGLVCVAHAAAAAASADTTGDVILSLPHPLQA